MKIEMTEEQIIFCDTITCDPLQNYVMDSHCENCPLIDYMLTFHYTKLELDNKLNQ